MNPAEDYSWHPVLRSILNHWVWQEKPFSKGQAWVDMILLAQHYPSKKLINGILVPLDEGQLAWPKYLLADRWGWSRDKVERFLKKLEADLMIRQQTSQLTTIITLLNYKELRKLAFGKQDNTQGNGQGNAQGNDPATDKSQYKKRDELEREKDPAREASTFKLPVRSEEAVALAAQAKAQVSHHETQADHDRAIAVMALYPDFAPGPRRPVRKGIPALNILSIRIAANREYAWEEHARLERDLNPSPVDCHNWAQSMPDPHALAGLRAAAKAKEESNGKAANPGRSQRSPGGSSEGSGARQAPPHAKASREFPERLEL